MTGQGTVERIFIAPEAKAEMRERTEVEAIAEGGVRGDRYCRDIETGAFVGWGSPEERPAGFDLTLIEREAIEAIERESGIDLSSGEHRRNVETSGVALNHLVGERFRIGDAVCRGVKLCEPCDHLQRLTEDGVLDAMVHRGGLRCDIVEGGTVHRGDRIVPIDADR